MTPLHPHEIAAIHDGRQTQLRRPVEEQNIWTGAAANSPTWYYDGYRELVFPWKAGDELHFDEFALEVTAVRVERVRDIVFSDTFRSGIGFEFVTGQWLPYTPDESHQRFNERWTELYPAHPWESAWCWVVEFEVVK